MLALVTMQADNPARSRIYKEIAGQYDTLAGGDVSSAQWKGRERRRREEEGGGGEREEERERERRRREEGLWAAVEAELVLLNSCWLYSAYTDSPAEKMKL